MQAELIHREYRPHISGLRAIAVLGVVIFHFQKTLLPGGFVGVDVFFVISGFLITRSIQADFERGTFSLFDFYERRARRVLPAMFVVTAITSVAAVILLFPGQLVDYAKSVLASITLTSNIYFYLSTNYFSPSADTMPLLHYWSVGVEEQFYIVFPALIVLFGVVSRNVFYSIIFALLLASLVTSEAMLRVDPAASFFLLPFRAFELLLGSMLTYRPWPGRAVHGPIVGAGLILILGSFILLDEATRFPGFTALLPCLGTAMVIVGAEKTDSLPSLLLAMAPLTFIGAISYSLYLVHWPVAVFWRMIDPDVTGAVYLLGGTALSILLGWLSYRLVERPVRDRRVLVTRPGLTLGFSTGAVLLAGVSLLVIQQDGFPGRLQDDVRRVLAYEDRYVAEEGWREFFRGGTCFLDPDQTFADLDRAQCIGSNPDVILWGNSWVAQFNRALSRELAERGQTLGQITASACPPFLGFELSYRPTCRPMNDAAADLILQLRPKVVIIDGDPTTPLALEGAIRSIERLKEGGIHVLSIGLMPQFNQPVPKILADRMLSENRNAWSEPGDDKTMTDFSDDLKRRFQDAPMVTFLSPRQDFCVDGSCLLVSDGIPLYFDNAHWTAEGADLHVKTIMGKLAPLLKGQN